MGFGIQDRPKPVSGDLMQKPCKQPISSL